MLKFSHAVLITLSGLVWLGVGVFLLSLGLNLIVGSLPMQRGLSTYPLIDNLAPYLGGIEQTAIVLIAISLFAGYMKGRYVLGKSAKKGAERIVSFPNPTSLANIYSFKYYILLAVMIGLGMSIKFLGMPNDVRGIVDVIIGSALINGAFIYFRLAFESYRKSSTSI